MLKCTKSVKLEFAKNQNIIKGVIRRISAPDLGLKTGILWVLSLSVMSLMACQSLNRNKITITEPLKWETKDFQSHENWVAMNVDYTPPSQIRSQIEQIGGIRLQNRGEAHITIITPPEYNILKEKISIEEINQLANKYKIQSSKFKPLCVGRGVKKDTVAMETYFIVVEAPELLQFRKVIFELYKNRKGNPSLFNAERFFPHITLGFTHKDLHESDGVIKSIDSCYFDLSDPNGKKI